MLITLSTYNKLVCQLVLVVFLLEEPTPKSEELTSLLVLVLTPTIWLLLISVLSPLPVTIPITLDSVPSTLVEIPLSEPNSN
jgi:hypothetical protein